MNEGSTIFYGRSPNAVSTQLWIAISVYLIVAIVRKRLGIQRDLYTLLQILSLSLFERIPLEQALSSPDYSFPDASDRNQLQRFDF
jgi:hypothetical protein